MNTFDQPSLDWNAADLYQEFERFKNHCTFVFNGPLSEKSDTDKAGWIGLWIGQQGREIYKTFNWTLKTSMVFLKKIRPRPFCRSSKTTYDQEKTNG